MKKRKKNKKVYLLIICVCIVAFIVYGIILKDNKYTNHEEYIVSENVENRLEEFVEKNNIVNIEECSDDFMVSYFDEINNFNTELNKYDEETQNEIKSNMLIVTSKENVIDSYGAKQIIKAPNNQCMLIYDSKEKMEFAKNNLDNDDKILDIDNNNVYTISEVELNKKIEETQKFKVNKFQLEQNKSNLESKYNSWGIESIGLDIASDIANKKQLSEEVVVAIIDTGCDLDLFEENYDNKIKGYHDVLR